MYTEREKRAFKFLDETDTAQFSTMELLTMFADKEVAHYVAALHRYLEESHF